MSLFRMCVRRPCMTIGALQILDSHLDFEDLFFFIDDSLIEMLALMDLILIKYIFGRVKSIEYMIY